MKMEQDTQQGYLMYQGMLENVTRRKQPVDSSYADMRNRKFRQLLMTNHYTNSNSFHLCFPIKIKKITGNNNNNIDHDLIMVNNFFAHWMKEINVTRYSDDEQILPTNSSYEIYQYFDETSA